MGELRQNRYTLYYNITLKICSELMKMIIVKTNVKLNTYNNLSCHLSFVGGVCNSDL